jgi:Meiotically Up-regulated Gene 113 (MUG113) protein
MQYLYLISCERFFKIGITGNVPARLSQLYTGNPFDMDVVSVYEFQNAEPVEQSIHQRFDVKRQRGEWFNLSQEDVDSFHEICSLLGGIMVDYESAISGVGSIVDGDSSGNGWRNCRKSMSEQDIYDIANGSVKDISVRYSLSERTALNWQNYARREVG